MSSPSTRCPLSRAALTVALKAAVATGAVLSLTACGVDVDDSGGYPSGGGDPYAPSGSAGPGPGADAGSVPEDEWFDDSSYDPGGSAAGGSAAGEGDDILEPEPPPVDQSGEQYEDPGANPFVETARDRFATFAIDVDTASYSLMRRDVNAGLLPVPEGVRVEEYVNFFRYGDAPPAEGEPFPFAIHLDARPSPFGAGLELLRVNLTGRDVDVAALKPANLIFLVDVSGSMQSSDKIGLVQYTLTELAGALRPSDTIGLVTYAGEVRVALPPTPVEDLDDILAAIESLSAGGSTYGEGGIRLAYDTAAQGFRQGGINRVILCTDGDFNVGLTGDALIELIEQERERGITLSAIGFGSGNYNDATMEQLADRGNGNYAYVDSVREADRLVKRDLSGMLQVIAKDVKIQLELNPEVVEQYRLIGYENRAVADQDFANDAVDGGEIGAGHQVTAFLELRLTEGARTPEPGLVPAGLVTARVRTKDPDGVQSRETAAELTMSDLASTFDDASDDLRFGIAVAETAEILRGSPHVDAAPHLDAVLDMARGAAGQDPDRREFVGLLERIAGMMP
jgi:Ca-activated chloride channel family protein